MQIKEVAIIYDVSAMPIGINLDNVYNILNESGILVWDSSRGSKPSLMTDKDIKVMDLKFLSKEEIQDKFGNLI